MAEYEVLENPVFVFGRFRRLRVNGVDPLGAFARGISNFQIAQVRQLKFESHSPTRLPGFQLMGDEGQVIVESRWWLLVTRRLQVARQERFFTSEESVMFR